jgi:hypothetical protein
MIMKKLSRRRVLGVGAFAGLGGLASASTVVADELRGPNPLLGSWTYRSFLNDPDPNTPFGNLEFAVAALQFEGADFGQVAGRLSFGDDYLALKGTITFGNPFTARFQGVGATPGTIEQGKPWIYDYLGYIAPAWPNGIDQRPAILGTVVRTVTHSQGQAKAGLVASFIAVREDADTPAPVDPGPLLTRLETAWAAAVMTNRPDDIARFLGDGFLFVGAGGILQTREQHLDDFRTGRLKVTSVQIKDAQQILWDGAAVVSARVSVVGKVGERDITGDYRFMDTWQYQGKQWLAVARQQTKVATP